MKTLFKMLCLFLFPIFSFCQHNLTSPVFLSVNYSVGFHGPSFGSSDYDKTFQSKTGQIGLVIDKGRLQHEYYISYASSYEFLTIFDYPDKRRSISLGYNLQFTKNKVEKRFNHSWFGGIQLQKLKSVIDNSYLEFFQPSFGALGAKKIESIEEKNEYGLNFNLGYILRFKINDKQGIYTKIKYELGALNAFTGLHIGIGFDFIKLSK